MATSRRALVGLILVIGGIAMYGGWHLWVATRIEVPLRMPISMAIGQVRSREFSVNISDPYSIGIEVETKIPFHS